MFGSTRKAQDPAPEQMVSSKPETIIGANNSFIGTLKTDGNVRIDGRVEGDIEILGNLIIGETGQVIATIKAQNVHVSGAVKGESTAVEPVSYTHLDVYKRQSLAPRHSYLTRIDWHTTEPGSGLYHISTNIHSLIAQIGRTTHIGCCIDLTWIGPRYR